jgi:hypothetical protein
LLFASFENYWCLEAIMISAALVTSYHKLCKAKLGNHIGWVWKHQCYSLILKAYILTFLLFLPVLCHKMPYSVYFMESLVPSAEEMLQKELSDAEQLAKEAWDYIQQHGIRGNYRKLMDEIGSRKESFKSPWNATVFVTVISINRMEVHGYLTRTVAKLHKLIKRFEKDSGLKYYFSVALCNVDTWPIDNRELYKVATALRLPIFERFAKPVRELGDNIFGKEKDDYAFCLHESLRYNPRFVLMLEDDALPVDHALWMIHRIVSYSFNYFSQYEQNRIAYFKLFHPSRLLGYISVEVERIPQLLALGAVFGTSSLWIYLKYLQIWTTSVQPRTRRHFIFLWVVFIFYFILSFLCIGHPNVLKIFSLSNSLYQIVPAPSCCTPAMLFPSHSGHLIADYLETHHGGHILRTG